MSTLPPIPYRIPLLDRNGLVDRNWQQWFSALVDRVGGLGDIVGVSDVENLLISSMGEQSASLVRLANELQDHIAGSLFTDRQDFVVEDTDIFDDAASSINTLKALMDDLEALTLYSW